MNEHMCDRYGYCIKNRHATSTLMYTIITHILIHILYTNRIHTHIHLSYSRLYVHTHLHILYTVYTYTPYTYTHTIYTLYPIPEIYDDHSDVVSGPG